KQLGLGQHVQHPVDGHRRALDRLFHLNLADQLFRLAVGEDIHVAVIDAEVDLTVHPVGRTPDARLGGMLPVLFAGLRIQAVQIARVFADVDQAVVNGRRAHGAAELDPAALLRYRHDLAAVVPDQGRIHVDGSLGVPVVIDRRDVALLTRVDAPEVTGGAGPPTAVRGRADADVDLAVVPHRRGDEVVALSAVRAAVLFRAAIELPDHLARVGLQAVQPGVAAGEDHLPLAVDLGVGRVAPLAVNDVLAGGVVLPQQFAALAVQGDDARGVRGRHIALVVNTVARDYIDAVANHQGRAHANDA